MRGGHGGGHGELEGGAPEHDLQPQVETWHEVERTRSASSELGCQGQYKDPLNLFPGPLDAHQPLLMPLPWRGAGESEG